MGGSTWGDFETGRKREFLSVRVLISLGKDLGIGAGAVGGVKPVDLAGCEN
jgi:hypothetical protein